MKTDTIAAAIAQVYRDAEAAPPTPERCIAPLGDLVEGYSLLCTELAQLTSRNAQRHLIQESGVSPFTGANAERLAGFLYASSTLGHIFVEQTDMLVRRRFSVAHEIGHYVLHFRPRLSAAAPGELLEMTEVQIHPPRADDDPATTGRITFTRNSGNTGTIPDDAQLERQANLFAVELLMPSDVVTALLSRYNRRLRGDDLVWRLATDMLVSITTMRYRLKNLGLLNSGSVAQEGEAYEP